MIPFTHYTVHLSFFSPQGGALDIDTVQPFLKCLLLIRIYTCWIAIALWQDFLLCRREIRVKEQLKHFRTGKSLYFDTYATIPISRQHVLVRSDSKCVTHENMPPVQTGYAWTNHVSGYFKVGQPIYRFKPKSVYYWTKKVSITSIRLVWKIHHILPACPKHGSDSGVRAAHQNDAQTWKIMKLSEQNKFGHVKDI